jgi:hypothetical protein
LLAHLDQFLAREFRQLPLDQIAVGLSDRRGRDSPRWLISLPRGDGTGQLCNRRLAPTGLQTGEDGPVVW